MNSKIVTTALFLSVALLGRAQKEKSYGLTSPDGQLQITIEATPRVQWSVKHGTTTVLAPSPLSLTLQDGQVLGRNALVQSSKKTSANTTIPTPVYKKASITDQYNQLALTFKGGYSILFRAYNDGVAYRFVTPPGKEVIVASEEAAFNFDKDYTAFAPHVRNYRATGDALQTSFEATYQETRISAANKDTLAFLPVLVALDEGKKAVLLESDLVNYPGMYLVPNPQAPQGFRGTFAPYPLEEKNGGLVGRNRIVTQRADYLAKVPGGSALPWRAVAISTHDRDLTNSDLVYKLATPTTLKDLSWIKPGKVAWDWWNDWNIAGVDFPAGINTATYKHYIDFAAENHLEYIIMDEGWSEPSELMKVVPAINLEEIVGYAKQKNVGVILWATWRGVMARMDEAFAHYAQMGVKGFKIDFLDRDDQPMVASTYQIAQKAAQYHLLVDYHGVFKPAGLQRTWPNVINMEGVKGLENVKWTPDDDVPRYDVSIPFIRMVAGPMDYTPGAMRNANKESFRSLNSMPMSQGTRTHQLAMYVVFEAPLQMLSDNPTAYRKEQESTDFIAKVPTTFDETVPLDGRVGEYVALARRKGNTWYVGAMTNWSGRELTLDLSFLPAGTYEADIFQDGVNADRNATDYKHIVRKVSRGDKLTIHLASGGGWAARIYPTTQP